MNEKFNQISRITHYLRHKHQNFFFKEIKISNLNKDFFCFLRVWFRLYLADRYLSHRNGPWGKMNFLLVTLIFIFGLSTFASANDLPLKPRCFSQKNKKDHRSILSGVEISDAELLTRLVFTEGISTNYKNTKVCKHSHTEIFEAIAWGVMNRVRLANASEKCKQKYGSGIKGVIFKTGQFNPSFSKHSRFAKLFLCPKLQKKNWVELWATALAAAQKAISFPELNPFLQTEWEREHHISLVSHFYYPSSRQARGKRPMWVDTSKKKTTQIKNLSIDGRKVDDRCISFFRLEKPFEIE